MPRNEMSYRAEIMDILADYRDEPSFDIGEAYDEIKYHSRKYFAKTRSTRKGMRRRTARRAYEPKKKRKLSAWNKYVKANSKKPRFRYRNGKLNLKKMAVAFRKTPAGKRKRRR